MTDLEPYAQVPVADPGGKLTAEQLVVRWLTTKRSPHTRFAYGLDLGVRLLRPGAAEIGEPGPAKAPDWLTYCRSGWPRPDRRAPAGTRRAAVRRMEAAGLAPATVARKLASVSSWYTWMKRQGYAAGEPGRWAAAPGG